MHPKTQGHSLPQRLDPWAAAWLLLLPLALCLVVDKTAKVMLASTWLGLTLNGSGLLALLKWLWAFNLLRFALALGVGMLLQHWLWPRRRWTAWPLAAGLMLLLALAVALSKRDTAVFALLAHWSTRAAEQGWMLLCCLWRDAIVISMLVLGLGLLLALPRPLLRARLVRTAQALVVLACTMVSLGLVYELAVGQTMSLRVLAFSLMHWGDTAPMVSAESSVGRAALVAGAVLIAAAWAWRHRALAHAPMAARRLDAGMLAALAGTAALFAPTPAVGFLEAERHSEATLMALYRSALPSVADAVQTQALQDYEAQGQGRWHGARAHLQAIGTARQPRNLVLVMMESMRAASTTLHTPSLATTPYLAHLASQGLQVSDMNAVIPRTAAAWMAILSGQYPLTNQSTSLWARENAQGRAPMRALPALLREQGYATAFFTPTHLKLLDDTQVIRAMQFEHVAARDQIAGADVEAVNYFGVGDEWMVDPVLDWSRTQHQAGRPFLAVLMTNVGHHAYETPSTWPKQHFDGVNDPTLAAYYNCLRYVDHVIQTLMRGYTDMGVLDDTVFVFIGDHGQMFGEHGLRQTFNAIYQHGVQVPMVIYAPGLIRQPGLIKGPRQQIDLLPTLAQLLDFRIQDAQLPGVSLLEPVPPDRPLFFSSSIDASFLALRQGARKYIYSYERRPIEVYDIASDPLETRQIQAAPDELTQARRQMLRWKAEAELSMVGSPGTGPLAMQSRMGKRQTHPAP